MSPSQGRALLRELADTLVAANEASERLQNRMLWLTWALAVFAGVQLAVTIWAAVRGAP